MKWKPGGGNLKGRKPGRESCKDPGPGEREIFGEKGLEKESARVGLKGWFGGKDGVGCWKGARPLRG